MDFGRSEHYFREPGSRDTLEGPLRCGSKDNQNSFGDKIRNEDIYE